MSDFSGANRPNSTAAAKQTAQEKAGEGVGLVSEKATDAADTAKERAGDVAGEASARARDVAGELRDQLQEQAGAQTQRLAQNLRRLADDLGDMGETGKRNSPATHAVNRIADHGRDAASRLEDRGPQGLVSDLQDFARRRPGVFLAGAALAGFTAARLGKGVKSADSGPTSQAYGDGSDRPAAGADEDGRRAATTSDQLYGAPDPADSYGQQPTPSYGGSVAPSGLRPVTEPYRNPDPQQP